MFDYIFPFVSIELISDAFIKRYINNAPEDACQTLHDCAVEQNKKLYKTILDLRSEKRYFGGIYIIDFIEESNLVDLAIVSVYGLFINMFLSCITWCTYHKLCQYYLGFIQGPFSSVDLINCLQPHSFIV